MKRKRDRCVASRRGEDEVYLSSHTGYFVHGIYGPFMDWFHIYLSILTPFPFDWLCVTFVSVTYTKWDGSEL